jgi:precorrin-6B methylase 2
MNKMLFQIYRVVVPKPVRTKILKRSLRKKILSYSASHPDHDEEKKEIIHYLENNEIRIFPYPFHNDYSPEKIEVFYDESKKMRYVLQDGRKLYFKKRWGVKRIRQSYCDLIREQDKNSPHRYLNDSFSVQKGDVLADIGAAEGNFSLAVIDDVDRIYLFEHDNEWIEALKATFEPWKDKVTIINKFVANKDDASHIKFDTFYSENNDVNFLKIDVDGAESNVLDSCIQMLSSNKPLKIALCTYHKNEDEKEFTALLKKYGFAVTPSNGYMINYYDKQLKEPYLRRGLLRGVR